MNDRFTKRINYKGDLSNIMLKICERHPIGNYNSYKVISVGYEDLNIVLITDKGKYLAKLFASFRSEKNCLRYMEIMKHAIDNGVRHPQLLNSKGIIEELKIDGSIIKYCMLEYIEGQNLHERGKPVGRKEAELIIQQAALINTIKVKPAYLYDTWAIINFSREFKKKKKYLTSEDNAILQPIVKSFKKVSLKDLPHTFVHGDILTTNVIIDRFGKIFILDFSVSNWYPRIQELAVILCDLLFDGNKKTYLENIKWAIFEYQKYIKLTPIELKMLPLFIQAAHASHILGATFEKSQGNTTEENNYWLELGRKGLKLSLTLL